jgi:hypothetical protein
MKVCHVRLMLHTKIHIFVVTWPMSFHSISLHNFHLTYYSWKTFIYVDVIKMGCVIRFAKPLLMTIFAFITHCAFLCSFPFFPFSFLELTSLFPVWSQLKAKSMVMKNQLSLLHSPAFGFLDYLLHCNYIRLS